MNALDVAGPRIAELEAQLDEAQTALRAVKGAYDQLREKTYATVDINIEAAYTEAINSQEPA